VTVQYATVDDTAAAGSDYTAASGTLTFAAGQTSRTIAVSILGDLVDEGAGERFRVRLSAPAAATLLDNEAFGEITDDDVARLSLASGPTVDEGDSGFTAAVFSVTLSNPAAFTITADYETRDGYGSAGARAGEDYVAATGALTFSPGQTMKNFTVQVIGDTRGEADEIFWAELKNASAPVVGNVNNATIRNDDDFRQLLPLIQR
jgi:chitinase